ncbi:MAG: glycosylase [Candidatus Marinimicrobia bacterium]|nr:glycosylase [Candidatus Neomarinimicrobiota bacterium]
MSTDQSRQCPPQWLESAAIYQIFVASFQDSNGDGCGDLAGLTARLAHIADLGFDTLWLCPIYDSPFRDAGYDVRDHKRIAPRYGTLADFDRLVAALHARQMRLIMDLVPGHTSDEHPWFIESRRHAANPYTERYIWSPTTFCGPGECEYPGSFIRGAAERDGNYLSNFFYFQPALNYGFADPDPRQPWQLPLDHPAVLATRQEMLSIMRFWLDRGVDGFRVDMAPSLIRANDPQALKAARCRFWTKVREELRRDYPDIALIAEWSHPGEAIESGFDLDFMIHFNQASAMKVMRGENCRTIVNLNDVSYFDAAGRGELQTFFSEMQAHLARIGNRGLLSVPTGNHDLPRYSVNRDEAEIKCLLTFLFTLPAVPTLYYGDEIGLRDLSPLPSKEGGYRRTGARTPMQWDDTEGAGFSTAPAADWYLPLDPDSQRPTVARQLRQDDSVLQHVKRLLKLRREWPALGARGLFRQLNSPDQPYPVIYERQMGRTCLRVAINPLAQPVVGTCDPFLADYACVAGEAVVKQSRRDSRATIHLAGRQYAVWTYAY